MLSMHSIREQCGSDDMDHFYDLCTVFFRDFDEVDTLDINVCVRCD